MQVKEYALPLAIILIMLSIAGTYQLYNWHYRNHVIKGTDFSNMEEGTILFWTDIQIPKNAVDGDYVLFFSSEVIGGLNIIYDLRDFRLKAGMPMISSEEEIDFSGNVHQIVYSFKKESTQTLYLDGKLIAKGPFILSERPKLTGLVIYGNEEISNERIKDEDLVIYDKALSEEDISNIFGN